MNFWLLYLLHTSKILSDSLGDLYMCRKSKKRVRHQVFPEAVFKISAASDNLSLVTFAWNLVPFAKPFPSISAHNLQQNQSCECSLVRIIILKDKIIRIQYLGPAIATASAFPCKTIWMVGSSPTMSKIKTDCKGNKYRLLLSIRKLVV